MPVSIEKIQAPRFISFVNVGEDPPNAKPDSGWVGRRQWNACIEYEFLSAGQGRVFSKQLERLLKHDIIVAYITGSGYVGIGRVMEIAIPIKDFFYNSRTLKDASYIDKNLFENSEEHNEKTEYVISVKWIKSVNKKDAYWQKGLFASRLIQCSMENQLRTLDFLKDRFNVDFI